MMQDYKKELIEFAIEKRALLFGEFKTKAGRVSPYFFNAGLFNDGSSLKRLGEFYARAILDSGILFDGLFGSAYKGIPLVATVAIALANMGYDMPFSFNRKEVKDHGEGGSIIGAPLQGRVLIIDDVISAGTSVRESVHLIRSAGAIPCGVVVALDRMEKGIGSLSAAQEIEQEQGIPVIALINLNDLVTYLAQSPQWEDFLARIETYQRYYGVQNFVYSDIKKFNRHRT